MEVQRKRRAEQGRVKNIYESRDYQNMAHKNTNLRNRACNIKQSTKLKPEPSLKRERKGSRSLISYCNIRIYARLDECRGMRERDGRRSLTGGRKREMTK